MKAFPLNEGDLSRNNLDALRLFFALIVVFDHVAALSDVPAFSAYRPYLSGFFAVKSFFVISGMLIYRSYTKSSSLKSYFEKRFRRIYPAYFTVVTVAAFALFSLSSLPASQYFAFGFWKTLLANLFFLNQSASLPGVFSLNASTAVNGALWTLKVEVLFYLSVPLIAYLCRRFGTGRVLGALFCLSFLWKWSFELLYLTHRQTHLYVDLKESLPGQLFYFIAGIVLLLNFEKLRRNFSLILCVTACTFLVDHFFLRGLLDVVWISGFAFFFGFVRYLGNFSKYGDFSYGTYIVHFPLLQTWVALGVAERSPEIFLLVALTSIALGAFLMWHLVENRFLAKSSHYRQATVAVPG